MPSHWNSVNKQATGQTGGPAWDANLSPGHWVRQRRGSPAGRGAQAVSTTPMRSLPSPARQPGKLGKVQHPGKLDQTRAEVSRPRWAQSFTLGCLAPSTQLYPSGTIKGLHRSEAGMGQTG